MLFFKFLFLNKTKCRVINAKNEPMLQALNKICDSTLFSESPLSSDLLSYLVKATLKNEKIKELNMAFDVFKKDRHFDATVRVNIHNLRNRLNNYYLTDGKNDPLSIHNIGNISSVKKFTDPNFMDTFSKRYFPGRENIFFYCLAEVKGIERTDLGLEIIYYREVAPKINALTDIF